MSDKKKIFIVDDDEVALTSLRRLLELSGFDVRVTQKAKEVIPLTREFKPDLVLLDLLMPGLGGLEVCEMLNNSEETKRIPVIVISALGKDEDIKKAYKLGVIGYFTKPYDYQELLREINKTIAYKESKP